MAKFTSKAERIDIDFAKDLKNAMRVRASKGLADPLRKEEVSLREATRLSRTCRPEWDRILLKIKTLERKKQ